MKFLKETNACTPETNTNYSTATDPNNHSNLEETNFRLVEITSAELLTEVKGIDIFKSSGIRGISSRILKDAMVIMLEEFTHLFNLSIKSGNVPPSWKIATVVPIPKVTNSTNVSDLRPISLLLLPGKILEKFIHDCLMEHLLYHNLLSDNQYGFQPGISTSDAIATLIDDVGLNVNNNKLTVATFIDFSKAFDTLDHGILLSRIESLHPHPLTYKWFQSYLEDRKQKTLINETYSS